MQLESRKTILALFSLAVVATAILVATSTSAGKPEGATLPKAAGAIALCPQEGSDDPEHWRHEIAIVGLGTFEEIADKGQSTPIMAKIGSQFRSKAGLKTVPLQVVSIGGTGFAEGLGETRFWLDATRPVTGAIWEKKAGTEFPAAQEMRFHFFFTAEALPGRILRSVNPAAMRSDLVKAFPPPPGTSYRLLRPVELEDVSQPGTIVGRVLSNHVVLRGSADKPMPLQG